MQGCMLRRAFVFSTVVLSVSVAVAAENGGCRERRPCGEPRLKFLDDLYCLGRVPSTRDPYEERIETERHDFTQSTTTVGRGVVQIEAGYSYFYHDEDDEIEGSHTTPELMLRIGLTDDIEFRIRWLYAWKFIDSADDTSSAEDLRWSFKLAATDAEGWVPESAIELRFTAPTGGGSFSTGRVEAGVDYIYAWELNEEWKLFGSTGFGTNGLGDFGLVPDEPAADRFIAWSQSVGLSAELGERTTIYHEFYGIFSHALENDYAVAYYNIGIDYYVSDNFVFDLRAGVGLTPDSDDFFSGIGGGYRF